MNGQYADMFRPGAMLPAETAPRYETKPQQTPKPIKRPAEYRPMDTMVATGRPSGFLDYRPSALQEENYAYSQTNGEGCDKAQMKNFNLDDNIPLSSVQNCETFLALICERSSSLPRSDCLQTARRMCHGQDECKFKAPHVRKACACAKSDPDRSACQAGRAYIESLGQQLPADGCTLFGGPDINIREIRSGAVSDRDLWNLWSSR